MNVHSTPEILSLLFSGRMGEVFEAHLKKTQLKGEKGVSEDECTVRTTVVLALAVNWVR